MTQYNTLNVKLSNSQLNKLKSRIKSGNKVTLKLSLNMVGNSNDEANVPHKLLLTNAQVSRIRRGFANGSSTNMKFSKTQLSNMIQSGGVLRNPFNGIFDPLSPIKMFNLIAGSYVKEIKKEIVNEGVADLLVVTGFDILGKEIKKGIATLEGSRITLTNNEMKGCCKSN